jgi:hypothetical protein
VVKLVIAPHEAGRVPVRELSLKYLHNSCIIRGYVGIAIRKVDEGFWMVLLMQRDETMFPSIPRKTLYPWVNGLCLSVRPAAMPACLSDM